MILKGIDFRFITFQNPPLGHDHFTENVLNASPSFVEICRSLDLIFVCIFEVFRRTREFFTHVEKSLLVVIFIYARYSWALSSKGSLPCHTYCDRGIRLQWSSPRTRDTQTFCRVFGSGTVTTCFLDLGVSRLGFDHPTFRGERSHPLRHRRGHWIWFHKHILWRDM